MIIYLFLSLARWLAHAALGTRLFIYFPARSVASSCWAHGMIIYLFLLLARSQARAADGTRLSICLPCSLPCKHVLGSWDDYLFIFITRSLAGSCCSWHPIIYLSFLLARSTAPALHRILIIYLLFLLGCSSGHGLHEICIIYLFFVLGRSLARDLHESPIIYSSFVLRCSLAHAARGI